MDYRRRFPTYKSYGVGQLAGWNPAYINSRIDDHDRRCLFTVLYDLCFTGIRKTGIIKDSLGLESLSLLLRDEYENFSTCQENYGHVLSGIIEQG